MKTTNSIIENSNHHKKTQETLIMNENDDNLAQQKHEFEELERIAPEVADKYPELTKRVYLEYGILDYKNNRDADFDFEVAFIVSLGFTDYDEYMKNCAEESEARVHRKLNKNFGFPTPSQN